ncbi:MAG: hypothetical protein EAZ97_03485 [Bacteroidetes bacterium]|nr:MAG: hypothetical protein EAZ97_03485 [Bacteroidota bacterium]
MTLKIKILSAIIFFQIIAIIFSLQSSDQNSTLNLQNSDFALDAQSEISKFEFGKIVLEKEGEIWKVNQKYKADFPMVKELTSILQKMSIRKPVAENQISEIKEKIMNKGITVNVFSGENLLKSFKIYGQENQTFGMIGEQPYLLYSQGFEIVLHQVFQMSELEWKDKNIFSLSWLGVRKIEMNYPKMEENSFKIAFDADSYKVEGVNRLDSVRVDQYLQQIANLRAAWFMENPVLQDSLSKTSPFCQIQIEDLSNEPQKQLDIYENPNGLFGILNKKELLMFDKRSLAKLLAKKTDFIKK